MRPGRCKYTQPIFVKAERGLRAAAADVARDRGLTLSELVRSQLREAVAAHAAQGTEARP